MSDMFYRNIGEKIKGWAFCIFILGAIASIIIGIMMINDSFIERHSPSVVLNNGYVYEPANTDEETVETIIMWDTLIGGIFTIILGPITAWISSWILYGFGEIIEALNQIAYNTYPSRTKNVAGSTAVPSLWKCKECGESNTQASTFCVSCGTKKRI